MNLSPLVTSGKEKNYLKITDSDFSLNLLSLIKKSIKPLDSPGDSAGEGDGNLVEVRCPEQAALNKLFSVPGSWPGLMGHQVKSSTTIYAPFTSNYSPSATLYELQGIKINPYGCRGIQASYIMTGATGSAFAAGGVGAVYVGAIDGKSTIAGSGSGQWINCNVPFDGATGTSCYGADILSPGKGPGGIGNVALVGTWTNSSDNLLGFYYKGSLNQLKNASAAPSQF